MYFFGKSDLGVSAANRKNSNLQADPLQALLSELERTRDRGYAIAVQELSLGLKTMAVPVFDVQDNVVASFGVSYPITRAQDSGFEDRLVEKLIEIKDSS